MLSLINDVPWAKPQGFLNSKLKLIWAKNQLLKNLNKKFNISLL